MTIKLHPSVAFGDGNHPTTQGMMQLLNELRYERQLVCRNILDMGCGSGILSILAAQLWPDAKVLAADIQEEAVQMTQQHAMMNKVSHVIEAGRSDGCSHPKIAARAQFDLVIANMLAEPLMTHAAALVDHTKHGAVLLVSGVLDWQEAQIRQAYESLGMRAIEANQIGEWLSMLYVREGG